jgi:hypothetical protein
MKHAAHGDAVDPRRQARIAAKRGQRTEHGDERLLDEVIDVARVAEDPLDRRMHPRVLAPEQRALGLLVPADARSDELAIVGGLGAWDELQGHST